MVMLKKVARKVRARIRELIGTAPVLRPSAHNERLIRLGTTYGGWTLADRPELHGSTIISAGLGEDGTFDIGFSERYRARVIIVDPTPRAIEYYAAKIPNNGCFELCPRALWNKATHLKFFAPNNPAHVSHSLINFVNNYATDTPGIEVETTTMAALVARHGLPEIVKLDIEGAEIEVVCNMLSNGIRPRQILVEYDEMLAPSVKSRKRIEIAHRALLASGYSLIHYDYPANFLYVQASSLASKSA